MPKHRTKFDWRTPFRNLVDESHYVQVPISTILQDLEGLKETVLKRDDYFVESISTLDSLQKRAANIGIQKRRRISYPPTVALFMDLMIMSSTTDALRDIYDNLRLDNAMSHILLDGLQSMYAHLPNLTATESLEEVRQRIKNNEPFIQSLRNNLEKRATERAKSIRKQKKLFKALEKTERRIYG